MKFFTNCIIFLIFTIIFFNQELLAQKVTDVSFKATEGQIYIYYTLGAVDKNDYNISVVLKRLKNKSFSYSPLDLSGDVGKGSFTQGKKKIVWSVSEKEMSMFDGDDFYFEVFVDKIKSSHGIPWYYFAGVAAVGGAVAAVLLGGKDNTSTTGTTNNFSFPDPPGRP